MAVERERVVVEATRLRQVGVMPSPELATELGIGPDSESWLVSVEVMDEEGGARPEFADRLIPVYVVADGPTEADPPASASPVSDAALSDATSLVGPESGDATD